MPDFEKQLIDCMPQLRGFIFKLVKDVQLIDDISQSVLLKAWGARDSFKGDSKLSTWLYQIAKNEVSLYYRKDNSNRHIAGLDIDTIKSSFDPFQVVVCGDMMAAYALTSRLSRGDKIIVLRRATGVSIRDISVELGKGEGAIKSACHRARQRLKKEFAFAN